MAATRLISSMNKTKPSSLFHSMRLNPISKVSIAGVSAKENVSETIEAFGRTLGFPIGNGSILNEKKPQFESFDSSLIGNTTLADRFRVDVRGRPVISEEEEEEDEDDDEDYDGQFDDADHSLDDSDISDDDDNNIIVSKDFAISDDAEC